MPTHSRVRSRRGPAITWTPTEDSHNELARRLDGATGATPLYLSQSAILELEAHLREGSSSLPFGLLAGDICLCPQTRVEYVLIDSVTRARIELTEQDPYTELAGELRSLISEQARHDKIAIGWYLGGLGDDLTLDSDATEMHRKLFPERWQVALVHGETAGTERGALLRFENKWNLWHAIPFYELISESEGPESRARGTALRWANYHAEATPPVDEHEEGERTANAPSRSWWRSRAFSALLRPLRGRARGAPAHSPNPSAERAPEWGGLAMSSLAHHTMPGAPKPAAIPVPAPPDTAATAVNDPSEAPPSDVHHVFIEGKLVSVPFAKEPAKQTGLGSRVSVRSSSLLIGALALVVLFVLYLIAS